ncbi:MAG: alpha/beta fold hydrolase [Colwellia sp.]
MYKIYVFFLMTYLTGSSAMAHNDTPITQDTPSNKQTQSYSSENQLEQNTLSKFEPFWAKGHFSSFQGIKNIRINYATFRHNTDEQSNNCLIIVPGRGESYIKYQEFAYDIYNEGYDLFIIDHRGQGLSERSLENTHKGYVEKFQYYVEDLSAFVNDIVLPSCQEKPFMLAHSMGGAIATTYLQQNPNIVKAAVLAAPMLAIPSHGLPYFLAKIIVSIGQFLEQLFTDTSWYFLGQENFKQDTFEENQLMHSKARYKKFSELYINNPTVQLGGVTFQWVYESLNAIEDIFSNAHQLKTPVIVLQGSEDTIVDISGQDRFCNALNQVNAKVCPNAVPITFEGAYHELFFEKDNIRNKAISTSLAWFDSHR